jgi:hypothetical protein
MFVVCQNRNTTDGPDASYVYYCDLQATAATPWHQQARCDYVMGNIADGGQYCNAACNSAVGGEPSSDDCRKCQSPFHKRGGETETDEVLQSPRVRDLAILQANAGGEFDLLLVEGSYPNSQVTRYFVTITTVGNVPTSSAPDFIPFLDATRVTPPTAPTLLSAKPETEELLWDLDSMAIEPSANVDVPSAPVRCAPRLQNLPDMQQRVGAVFANGLHGTRDAPSACTSRTTVMGVFVGVAPLSCGSTSHLPVGSARARSSSSSAPPWTLAPLHVATFLPYLATTRVPV